MLTYSMEGQYTKLVTSLRFKLTQEYPNGLAICSYQLIIESSRQKNQGTYIIKNTFKKQWKKNNNQENKQEKDKQTFKKSIWPSWVGEYTNGWPPY